MPEHPFWWILSMACVIWYSTVTVYVGVLGVKDIRHMLARLSARSEEETDTGARPDSSHTF